MALADAPPERRRQAGALPGLAGGLATAALVVAAGLAVWLLAEPYQVRIATGAFINLILVLGLQVFMGNTGIAHLGHSAFAGLGGYGMAVLATPVAMKKMQIPNAPFGLGAMEMPVWAAALASLGAALAAAVLVGRVISRLAGVAATIVTLALLVIVHSLFMHWPALFKGSQAFFGVPITVGLPGAVAAAAALTVAARLIRDSAFGVQLRATAQSPLAAQACGIDAAALRWRAFVLSALFAAVGGVLYASFLGTISPRSFYFTQTFGIIAMLILGGMATVSGAVLGCLLLSLGLEAIRSLESGAALGVLTLPPLPGLSGLALGAVIVLVMAWRPQGIIGTEEPDEWWVRRRARLGSLHPSRQVSSP